MVRVALASEREVDDTWSIRDRGASAKRKENQSSSSSRKKQKTYCDAPKPGGPLTTRQPAEYKWRSGYPTPLQKIG